MIGRPVDYESIFHITANYAPDRGICCFAEENEFALCGQDRSGVCVYAYGLPDCCDVSNIMTTVEAAARLLRGEAIKAVSAEKGFGYEG